MGREAENEVGRDAGRMANSIQMNGIEEARPKVDPVRRPTLLNEGVTVAAHTDSHPRLDPT